MCAATQNRHPALSGSTCARSHALVSKPESHLLDDFSDSRCFFKFYLARLHHVNITHHAAVKRSERAMCSLSASTPSQLIEGIEADSVRSRGAQWSTRGGGGWVCSFFDACALVSVSAAGEVVSLTTFPFAQRGALQGGSRAGLALHDKSISHSQSHCHGGSPSPSIPLSFIHASAGLWTLPPPPPPDPPASTRLTLLRSTLFVFHL